MDKQRNTVLWMALLAIFLLVGVLAVVWLGPAGADTPAEDDGGGWLPDLKPNPTPTIYPSSETVIRSVQQLSRLETSSFHIEKVITAESGQGPLGFLFGDKLLLIAYGEVIAGVDLAKLGAGSISQTDEGTLYVKLPPVEIFVATLDNERTHVYDRQTGVAGLNTELETEARQEAQRMILEAALEDGIKTEAEDNAKEFLESFLTALGFEAVVFVDTLPTPTVAPTMTPTSTSGASGSGM